MAENISNSVSSSLCKFCMRLASKYTCPRCNKPYCSVNCYRGESHMQCSEAFYRDCFMGAIQEMGTSNEAKQKVADILSRVYKQGPLGENSDEGECDDDDLHERFEHLNLDQVSSDEILARLTHREKQEFEQKLQEGGLGALIESWEPWWLENNNSLVEDMTKAEGGAQKRTTHPAIMTKMPNIDELLRNKAPSKSLQYDILNVLYGFVYLARRYNGDYMETPLEGVETVLEISNALRKGTFLAADEAINDGIGNSQKRNSSVYVSHQFSIAVIEDLCRIISRKSIDFVLAALSELWRMFRKAMKEMDGLSDSSEIQDNMSRTNVLYASADSRTFAEQKRKELYSVKKKLEFFLAWCNKYGHELRSNVAGLQLEYCRLSSELLQHEDIKSQFEAKWGGALPPPRSGKLIEEL